MGKMVFIKNFPNRGFAEQAREILETNRIGSIIQSADPGIMGSSSASMSQGVNLYVDSDNKEQALQLINALYNGI